ncbi:cell division protein FtsK [Weissella diestrammenae]|uniref:Cell division protein FtsK n=1 Tax=Weissella diestrammenae TaxID=1162633 RepID=A0A7G9T3Q9_9LACO|nr:cell division protein FtsK [Weissella diestrammenae]MCM0582716.1 cell division protein FtsK [Weissella diestrammenae]QNN74734.1 cell division protein FtsK [Weissella diestrammenae]
MYRKIKYGDQYFARTLFIRSLLFISFSLLLINTFMLFLLLSMRINLSIVMVSIVMLIEFAVVLSFASHFLQRLYTEYPKTHDNWLSHYIATVEVQQILSKLVSSKGAYETNSDDKGEYITYYPKIKFKLLHATGQLVVEEPIDAEKSMDFFASGQYDKLIETSLLADLQNTASSKGKIVSTFAFDPIKFRLQLADLAPKKGTLNVMRGIDWKYDKFYNMLIAGNVGTGKSYTLFSILGQLLVVTKFVTVFDPKKSDLASLKYTKALEGKVFSDNTEINEQVHVFYEEMMQRAEKMENIKKSGKLGAYMDFNFAPHFMFFDEFGAWRERNDALKFGSPEYDGYQTAMSNLLEIAMLGRELGFYIIVGMQRPSADSLPMAIRNQLNFKMVMGVPTPEISKMLFPDNQKDLRALSQDLKGWGFLQSGNDQVRSFFAPEMPKGFNLHEWIEMMNSQRKDKK